VTRPRTSTRGLTNFQRINMKVDTSTDCWLWTGTIGTEGYGQMWTEKQRNEPAHRVCYEMFRGPVPVGLELDHLCRNRRCVRPDHLEAVSHQENTLRGIGPTAANARKNTCLRGHLYTQKTMRVTCRGLRVCKTCVSLRRAAIRAERARLRAIATSGKAPRAKP
jgi:hypothetical protein